MISNIPLVQLCTCCLISGRLRYCTVLEGALRSSINDVDIYIICTYPLGRFYVCLFSRLYKFGGTPVHDTLVCPPPLSHAHASQTGTRQRREKRQDKPHIHGKLCRPEPYQYCFPPIATHTHSHTTYHIILPVKHSDLSTLHYNNKTQRTQTINHHPLIPHHII